jgi:hypothetical protein
LDSLLVGHLSRDATLITPETILDSADRGDLGLVAGTVPFGDLDAPDKGLNSGWGSNHRVFGLGEEFEFFMVHRTSRVPI